MVIPFVRNKVINLTRRLHKFLHLERAGLAEWQGASEGQKFVAKPTQSNMTLFFTSGMILPILDELIAHQRKVLFETARRIVPQVTDEDLLQPNDFPELEFHPHFRHEEGILDGLLMARTALQKPL